jgi:hypothetical protein
MKTRGFVLCAVILGLSAVSATAEFKAYPGAQRDLQLEQGIRNDPRNQGMESEVYLTPDPFEKVYQFYKAIGTEDETIKKAAPKLPNGGKIQWAFFTFDGAKSIAGSKVWAKVQRPTVVDPEYKDIRDVTSIQLVRKK